MLTFINDMNTYIVICILACSILEHLQHFYDRKKPPYSNNKDTSELKERCTESKVYESRRKQPLVYTPSVQRPDAPSCSYWRRLV